jgi:predicted small secreted protein
MNHIKVQVVLPAALLVGFACAACHNTAQGVKADTRNAVQRAGHAVERTGEKIENAGKK